MIDNTLNFKHLFYFWVVAKEGSIARAADRLGVAAQTISGQLKPLERSLGHALFKPRGRGLTLTEAGRTALSYADQIFLLGEQLVEVLDDPNLQSTTRLHVGTTDALPKLVAYELLEPLFADKTPIRLQCHEGEFEELLAELALHKLDVVLADRPASTATGLKVFNHPIGECEMAMFGTATLREQYGQGYPQSLNGAPVLLPTRHTAIRSRIDHWLLKHGIRPRIIGEFEDSALLATFGATGLGVFPAVSVSAHDLNGQHQVVSLGPIDGVNEQVFAITNEQRIQHPLIEKLLENARHLWSGHENLAGARNEPQP